MHFYWTPECLVRSGQEQLCVQSSSTPLGVPAERQTVPPPPLLSSAVWPDACTVTQTVMLSDRHNPHPQLRPSWQEPLPY